MKRISDIKAEIQKREGVHSLGKQGLTGPSKRTSLQWGPGWEQTGKRLGHPSDPEVRNLINNIVRASERPVTEDILATEGPSFERTYENLLAARREGKGLTTQAGKARDMFPKPRSLALRQTDQLPDAGFSEKDKPVGSTLDLKTRDYWDEHLEYNAIRRNPKDQFMASTGWILEAAGDVIREMTGQTGFTHPDGGMTDYIAEKLDRIESAAAGEGYRGPATFGDRLEITDEARRMLERIQDDAHGIPVSSEPVKTAKEIVLSVITGSAESAISHVRSLREQLGMPKSELHERQSSLDQEIEKMQEMIRREELEELLRKSGETNKAHGGPIYASEALHMQSGGPLSTMISIQPKPPEDDVADIGMEEPVSAAWDAFRYSGTREDVLRRREILKSFESEKLLEESLLQQARTNPERLEMANTEYTMPYWPDIIKDPVTALAWDPDKISSIPGINPGFVSPFYDKGSVPKFDSETWAPRRLQGWYDQHREKIGINPKYGVMQEEQRGIGETRRDAFEKGKRVLLHELRHKGIKDLGDLTASRWADLEAEQANKTYENPTEAVSDRIALLKAERDALVMRSLQTHYRETEIPFTQEDVVRLQDIRGAGSWKRTDSDKDEAAWVARFNADNAMLTETLRWLDQDYPRPKWLASDEGADALRKINNRYEAAQRIAVEEITKRWPGWNYEVPPQSVYQGEFDPAKIFQDRYGYLPARTDDQLTPEQLIENAEREYQERAVRSLPPHPSGGIPKPPGLILEPATPLQPTVPDTTYEDLPGAAHGGPIHASEGGEGPQDVFRPPIITLPAPFEQLRNLEVRHEEVPQSRPSVKEFPGDPKPPPIGSPIIEQSLSFPLGPAQGTIFRTQVPERAVGITPSGAVMRKAEELGVRVEGLPVARVGPVSVALNIDLFKTKEGISGPGIKRTIGSQLKRFGIVGQGEDFQLHFNRTTTDVKGGPSQTEHSGRLVVNVLRDKKFGTPHVYVNVNELEGKLEGSIGIRGGFKFAEGGLASMAPEARAMFGKPHPMTKATFAVEPRLTDLGPSQSPGQGVANLCGVARNMNRSVVA
jgi:hypothetical protein